MVLESVTSGGGLGSAVWAALRLAGLGLCWNWLLPAPQGAPWSRASRALLAAATAVLLGTMLSLLVAWALAELSLYHRPEETAALVGLALLGLLLARTVGKVRLLAHIRQGLPGLLGVTLAFAAVLALPERGEWIVGGWDPGIYVGEGLRVEREGTFHPGPEPFLASLAPEEWPLFTREAHGFTEYLPVVPIDPASARIQPFFFRLTSAAVAVMARCGGLRAATRVNLFLGVLSLVLLAGLLMAHRQPASLWVPAVLLLVLHPIWIFLLHFPTSEMLQLLCVLGLGLLLPYRFQHRGVAWIMALLLFAAMLNRFSFFPFAGLFLCAMTWMDLPRERRDPALRMRLLLAAATVAGAAADFFLCRVTLVRLDDQVPPLVLAGLGGCLAAVLVDMAALCPRVRRALCAVGPRGVAWALLAAGLFLLAAGVPGMTPRVEVWHTIRDSSPYVGAGWLAAAAAGLVLLLARQPEGRSLTGFLFFLLGATWVTYALVSISALYPWAARRYLEFTLPALCILPAAAVSACWRWEGRRTVGQGLAALLWLLLVAGTAPQAREAWRHTEFNGLSAQLANIAAAVGPEDVLVADHFRWGTPLRLIYGRQVLNGEVWWQDGNAASTRKALRRLAAYRKSGRDIFFLTSTERGLDVFPAPVGPVRLVWDSGPVELHEIAHRARQQGFPWISKTKRFILYQWMGSGD